MHFNGFGTHVSLIEYGLSIGNLLLIYFLVAACFVDWLTGTKVLGETGSTHFPKATFGMWLLDGFIGHG